MKILESKVKSVEISIITDDGIKFDVEANLDTRGIISSMVITIDGKVVEIGSDNFDKIEKFLDYNLDVVMEKAFR